MMHDRSEKNFIPSALYRCRMPPSLDANMEITARTWDPAAMALAPDPPMANSPLEVRIARRLADLHAAGLWRSLAVPSGVDLSSNDYLNLARHPMLVERLVEAAA